uniref:Energy transducer TonB n=1 Tax=Prevotella sp. GTC17260 TaxID=3236796 RepID=A0AB33JB66_9BACT
MEVKKSYKANLEDKRLTMFLIGLVLVLSACFVALEYTATTRQDGVKDLLSDDDRDDLEMMSAMDRQDMISAAPASVSRSVTNKVKPVDHLPEVLDRLNPNTGDAEQGADAAGTKAENGQTETQDQPPVVALNQNDEPVSFRIVQQLPEYPGGMVEFMKWLTKTLKYPVSARQAGIQGRVVVSFIINQDGSIADVRIEKAVHPLLDREALRVVGMMPKWKPGIMYNKPCRTMFSIPINFNL